MIKLSTPRDWRDYMADLSEALFEKLQADEWLMLNLLSETSLFVRLNTSKVRQVMDVEDTSIHMDLMVGRNRRCTAEIPLTFMMEADLEVALNRLKSLREEAKLMPVDASIMEPPSKVRSETIVDEEDFRSDGWLNQLIEVVAGSPAYGLVSAGRDVRGLYSSTGSQHWFQSSRYFFDYSLRSKSGLAVKNLLANTKWNKDDLQTQLTETMPYLEVLERPIKTIPRGQYRVYLGPKAVHAIIELIAASFGEGGMRRGHSGLRAMRDGGQKLHSMFNLVEHALDGVAPRFNELGELAPAQLPMIKNGELVNTLVSPRTAKEFGVPSNGATGLGVGLDALWGAERLRAAEIAPGTLPTADALTALEDGLYIGNLHYLNWSDHNSGRLTGMTRFDCFVVEKGQLVAPFQSLRFDDSVFRMLGSQLEALTQETHLFVETGTYERRSLGGYKVPGALLKEMTFTL
jgi:predicted Zn-dependent protease